MLDEGWTTVLLIFGFFALAYTWTVTILMFLRKLNKNWMISMFITYAFLVTATILGIGVKVSLNDYVNSIGLTKHKLMYAFWIIFSILAFSNFIVFTVIYVLRKKNLYHRGKQYTSVE
ncbi:hypothetical protein [Mycoplasma phocoeninasale]|uniref:Uncharacterized protein n=1 Tax=Mycoplasma phocoeninasale TaxID=2726117 RepID=A0A858TZP6_9MOLU|nr:hypothetical protein [Mycoplasma phocoeninasale]MBN0970609.1 hypothetical protein [Mycoplasma phocoeninasale]QJG66274.1 hypothetical protein HGG64_00915 [Mycoplasma phocoeninasale]